MVQTGKLEVINSVEVPRAARKIRATLCPKLHITDPEFVVMGGEDTCVYIYDFSKPGSGPLVLNQLQVSHLSLQAMIPAAHIQLNRRMSQTSQV